MSAPAPSAWIEEPTNLLALGCGGNIFARPVALEPTLGDPPGYDRDPAAIAFLRWHFPAAAELRAERLAAALSGLSGREPVSLEILATPQGITYQAVCQRQERQVLADRLTSALGGLTLSEPAAKSDPLYEFLDHWRRLPPQERAAFRFRGYHLPPPFVLSLERPCVLATNALLETLARLVGERRALAGLQLLLVPTTFPWLRSTADYLAQIGATREWTNHRTGETAVGSDPDLVDQYTKALKRKAESPFFAVALRVFALGRATAAGQVLAGLHAAVAETRRPFDQKTLAWHSDRHYARARLDPEHQLCALRNRITYTTGMVLSAAELAALFPLPSARVLADPSYRLERATKTLPAPEHFTEGALLGTNTHRGAVREVRLTPKIRSHHLYLPAKPGMGKSTLMANLIAQDIAAGHGVAVIDPEGSLIEKVLAFVPPERIGDVVYFDATDETHAASYNALNLRNTTLEKRRKAVLEILERTVGPFSDLMQLLLTRCLTLLLSLPGSTLRDLSRIFYDEGFRTHLLEHTKDGDTLRYWRDVYPSETGRLHATIDGICNRLASITEEPAVRDFTCQRATSFDLTDVINHRKIFLANLLIETQSQKLLGQFLVSEFKLAAWNRLPETGPYFFLYADEFQLFVNAASFRDFLERGRKRRVGLILAHQYTHQLGPLAEAIRHTVSSTVAGNLGYDDAVLVAHDFADKIHAADITTLPPYHAWAKVFADCFSLKLAAPLVPPLSPAELAAHVQRIKDHSRRAHARERAFLDFDTPPGYAEPDSPRRSRAPRDKPAPGGRLAIDQSHDDL